MLTYSAEKVDYNYVKENGTFERTQYPTACSLGMFLTWSGLPDSSTADTALRKWGRNEFDIPLPNFLDMYLVHLVAPFFVFQVLCLFLWSLDDYWYYSAFTLLMLMLFEGMMCKQRQASLTMLRNMRRPPVMVFVHRAGRWGLLSSDMLVPGDLMSLSSVPLVADARSRGSAPRSTEVVVPCDAVLVRGSGVANEAMLTGESVPQVKESLATVVSDSAEGGLRVVDLGSGSSAEAGWRRHLLFRGTSLVLHNEKTDADAHSVDRNGVSAAPDRGCLAVVVRTGFGTSQGGLMRKILFATERVTGDGGGGSSETFFFIGVLVVFAIMAAGSVLLSGLRDERRNKFRLVLHCIMIVTSVVPPELPMELSLAVTNSLAALSRSLVYCTEPFRISLAGKLDVLCFDKTGTLTKDEMVLRGVVAPQDESLFGSLPANASTGGGAGATSSSSSSSSSGGSGGQQGSDEALDLMLEPLSVAVSDVFDASCSFDAVVAVMGACHDLVPQPTLPGSECAADTRSATGDPLEQAAMQASGFVFDRTAPAVSMVNSERELRVTVRHKYPFSSALKRMSVLVTVESFQPSVPSGTGTGVGIIPSKQVTQAVFTKGAPEVLAGHLAEVPAYYRATYQHHMSRGRRVLAIACKRVLRAAGPGGIPRSHAESGLRFLGFLVFDCDLKADSRSVMRELRAADHRVAMITGDSVFTAVDIARKLGMLAPPDAETSKACANLTLCVLPESDTGDVPVLTWRRLADFELESEQKLESDVPFAEDQVPLLARTSSLCVTGGALSSLERRLGPAQYAALLVAVCPHVAVFARVSPSQKESVILALNGAGLFTLMCGDGTNDVGALKAAHVGISIVNDPAFERRVEAAVGDAEGGLSAPGVKKPKGAAAKGRMARALRELQEQDGDPTVVKLGDASIASSFTARRTSIDSVLTVVRQGRCTLVTTIQVYKILALNCLVSAFMMSALYLRGLKQGDTQMTASGLIVAGLFFFLSQAKPLQRVSPVKPPSSVFAVQVALSILGQFVVHICSLMAVLWLCESHVQQDDLFLVPDGKFQPNVVNSAMFLLTALMQVNNFVVNYRGHPFTQSITENLTLWRSVQVLYGALLVIAGGQLRPLNDLLQMAPFPSTEFQTTLVCILVVNFCASYAVEKMCQSL